MLSYDSIQIQHVDSTFAEASNCAFFFIGKNNKPTVAIYEGANKIFVKGGSIWVDVQGTRVNNNPSKPTHHTVDIDNVMGVIKLGDKYAVDEFQYDMQNSVLRDPVSITLTTEDEDIVTEITQTILDFKIVKYKIK